MAEVVVIDLEHVTVDGESVGCVLDVPENRPDVEGIKSLTLAALRRWSDDCDQCSAEEARTAKANHEADLAELKAQHAAELAAHQQNSAAAMAESRAELSAMLKIKHAEGTAKLRAELASKDAMVADLKAQIEALGGTELGQRLAKEAKIKAAQEALAKAQADLQAAHSGGESVNLVARGGESKSYDGWVFDQGPAVDLTSQGRTFSAEGDAANG